MPTPGLIIPRIHPNDVIDADKIDTGVRLLADHINGGLTVANLDPAFRISRNTFSESSGVTILNASSNGAASGTFIAMGCPTLVDRLSIRGLGWAVVVAQTNIARTLTVRSGVSTIFTTNMTDPAFAKYYTTSKNQIILAGFRHVDNTAYGSNNDSYNVTWTLAAAGETMIGFITATMASDWVA
jgi:hypothetical protein